uniref:Uncharacterized protein n=1 Tax=virus sp. ctBM815 TaxID=2825806 RepID=A0A8S5RKQ4_9VIRU|nr:MAG TPA: hypothetical protein [virus sp. ctBM815]
MRIIQKLSHINSLVLISSNLRETSYSLQIRMVSLALKRYHLLHG